MVLSYENVPYIERALDLYGSALQLIASYDKLLLND